MSVSRNSMEVWSAGLLENPPESKNLSTVEIPVVREKSDRRRAPRFSFMATIHLVELKSRVELQARTSDLSRSGCYVDTLNPFPADTEVCLKISHQGKAFTALGRVAYTALNMGMGVAFVSAEPDQLKTLREWLAELKAGAN